MNTSAKRLVRYFQKKFIIGMGLGSGMVLAFGIYMLVQAVVPGDITNPTFGPLDHNVAYIKGEVKDCQWMPTVNAGRPNFAQSDCPAGKQVAGYHIQASNNSQEDWELYVLTDQVRARRISDGSSMWAQAYCCVLKF